MNGKHGGLCFAGMKLVLVEDNLISTEYHGIRGRHFIRLLATASATSPVGLFLLPRCLEFTPQRYSALTLSKIANLPLGEEDGKYSPQRQAPGTAPTPTLIVPPILGPQGSPSPFYPSTYRVLDLYPQRSLLPSLDGRTRDIQSAM